MMHFLFVVCAAALLQQSSAAKLTEEFSWKQLDYTWPSQDFKQNALKTGAFVPENNLALGLATWRDKLFITVPRWKAGIASSLNYVKIGSDKSSPLMPYPSWEANYIPVEGEEAPAQASTGGRDNAPKAEATVGHLKDNATIVSVFRVSVDKCDRLWVMDTGLADILGAPKVIAKPSIVIFDLKTDKLLRRYFFKDSDMKESSFFANIVVDSNTDSCDNSFAYVPDLGGYGVVVYSLKDDDSWRVKHHYFHFDPLAGQYKVGGINFQWTDGVFGLALSKAQSDGYRKVYFHAFSSTKEFEVSTRILQNKTLATSSDNFHAFKLVGERGPNTQASANYYDEKSGILFYTQVNRDGVACWNSAKPMSPETTSLVVEDAETLEFPNDLKVDDYGKIWVLSDKLPKYIYKSLDQNDTNYRILTIPVEDAVKGTVCA